MQGGTDFAVFELDEHLSRKKSVIKGQRESSGLPLKKHGKIAIKTTNKMKKYAFEGSVR